MNKIDHIKDLLELYRLGMSTLSEEKELRDYFKSGNVDPSLKQDREVFIALDSIKVPTGLEGSLGDMISKLDRERVKTRLSLRRMITRVVAAAACIAAVVIVSIRSYSVEEEDILCGMTPEEVVLHTTTALQLVSRTINTSSNTVSQATLMAMEVASNSVSNNTK